MTPTERLLSKLKKDFDYRVTLFMPVKGYWLRQDVHRWEAHAIDLNTGYRVTLVSWDTITACASKNIVVRKNDCGQFEFTVI